MAVSSSSSSSADRSPMPMRKKRRRGAGATAVAISAADGAVVDATTASSATSLSRSAAARCAVASGALDTAADRATNMAAGMNMNSHASARMGAASCGGRVATMALVVAGWYLQGAMALRSDTDGVFFDTGKARWGGGEDVLEDQSSCNTQCDTKLVRLPFYVVMLSVVLWVVTSAMGENETDFLKEKVIICGIFVVVLYMMIFDWQKRLFLGDDDDDGGD